ncbi:hypothetical protein DXT98_05960 [Agrobacterium sp. ICMP 7243]|uniref:hypothetical protein n=1 Tax=Rhizobium rhizogenes TaxID=359 RepID=UPI00123B92A2|nr:hypothetical protein [Rhizobium rhizogenes]KAA6489922.1 hypothetical protein DXT98_05960 [Agrobacterium sp. ICMP 7243]NTF48825.1 hypothetical protein [Rhizobium rhizogenes]NTH06210.1 hypothetical protein [Rhizobium rhizogenes]
MAGTVLYEASRLFNLMRVRVVQRTAQHTLDEIVARFPAHLIDDVNARGLPPDRMLCRNQSNEIQPTYWLLNYRQRFIDSKLP